jgi:hypothetical protein
VVRDRRGQAGRELENCSEREHSALDDTEHLSALRAELVKLIINQERIFSNWVKFAITVQGGLAAGLAFVLSDVAKYRVLGFIIAIFGVLTAVLFAAILVRHTQWSVWYLRRWNNLAATSEIFPARKGEIRKLIPGPITCSVVAFLLLVATASIVIFFMVVL